jgi:S-adenosylmethionine decarboxylase
MSPVKKRKKDLKLQGFNNLTKSLSFNIYDISYTPSKQSQKEYLEYIDEVYNAERLCNILKEVTNIIGAHIISTSTQDYDPLGASATILISEEIITSENVVMHLDKSHVSAHTYPETNEHTGISTFRVDIDVSTCGMVSPLNALDFLIKSFDSDIVVLDYKVRGFTRDVKGRKHYIDHEINSILDFVSRKLSKRYKTRDVNNYQDRQFHTSMVLKKVLLDDYLFEKETELSRKRKKEIKLMLQQEMEEIYNTI